MSFKILLIFKMDIEYITVSQFNYYFHYRQCLFALYERPTEFIGTIG